jgi:diguanylate cyclase (GGDEF)-like protein/hemerythrin-like metal-binding protein
MARLLIVGGDPQSLAPLRILARTRPCDVEVLADAAEVPRAVAARPFDLVVVDADPRAPSPLALLRELRRHAPGTEVVLLAAGDDVELAVEAMKLGAYDCLPKPVATDRLVACIDGVLDELRQVREASPPGGGWRRARPPALCRPAGWHYDGAVTTFAWDPQFATGLVEVDAQHRRLVELIDGFSASVEQGARLDAAALARVYEQLAGYAKYHFEEEEKLMAAAGLDRRHVERHEREHADFCRSVEEMVGRAAGDDGIAARQLVAFLVHWLTYHILGSDQAMARQMRSVAAGAPAAQAYADEERAGDAATATLLRSVSALFEALSARNHELTAVAASLEARVEERTRELTVANGELRALVARVERMAMTDSLTELPNRRYAMDRLAVTWSLARRHGHPLACLVIDADGFKEVNDRHGHDAGDGVLRALATAMRQAVRTTDEVCRLGGDEFLVIAPETGLDGALVLGERVRAAVAALRVEAGGGAWHGSISVGVAVADAATADAQALLRAADAGVYEAKRCGRNAVRVAPPAGAVTASVGVEKGRHTVTG